jgi:hypothetical protein
MALKFDQDSEAFLAVLTIVIGADDVGSLEERDFLFSKVKDIPIFGNPNPKDFLKLLGQVTDTVYANVPQADGAFTPAGIDALLAAAKAKLNPELRKTLVSTANEIGAADGAEAKEDALLEKVRGALA